MYTQGKNKGLPNQKANIHGGPDWPISVDEWIHEWIKEWSNKKWILDDWMNECSEWLKEWTNEGKNERNKWMKEKRKECW